MGHVITFIYVCTILRKVVYIVIDAKYPPFVALVTYGTLICSASDPWYSALHSIVLYFDVQSNVTAYTV